MKSFLDFINEAEVEKNDEFTFKSIGGGISPLEISLPTQRNPELKGSLELGFFSGKSMKYNLVMTGDLEIEMKTLNGNIAPSKEKKSAAETNIEKIINEKKIKLNNDLLEVLERFDAEIEKVLKENGFEKA
jgi:hypothetical protein